MAQGAAHMQGGEGHRGTSEGAPQQMCHIIAFTHTRCKWSPAQCAACPRKLWPASTRTALTESKHKHSSSLPFQLPVQQSNRPTSAASIPQSMLIHRQQPTPVARLAAHEHPNLLLACVVPQVANKEGVAGWVVPQVGHWAEGCRAQGAHRAQHC
jgi:hypothetical protein